MSHTYNYGSHSNLTPAELFLFIVVDETCSQLEIDDVEAVLLILSGLPLLPTRAKPLGATRGTSVASVMSRSLFRYELKHKVLPTFTWQSMKQFRWILTHRLSVFVGRTIPGAGWVLLANDAYQITHNTVLKYDRIVGSEDRVF
ncbi:STM2901 family protein [Paraburkholderia susongensis]|uniref:Uncharacterized protein n=1 Tax=Paraburkholderia susongensis TaxID=1515439 RepID=A0A1X7LP66_9BURK|nr:hypothetical protein [Paraburkholderia susongensis]SMG55297.1 hypothetical protein SAMN06265784_107191 [Paraburkholderia susongensis]